jgi:phospholipid transport system substrate-binding protein
MKLFAPRSLALAVLLLVAPAAQAAETASTTVARLNTALIEVMRDAEALGFQGRYDRLAPELKEIFDFPAMAKVILGSAWNRLGEAQRDAFTAAFTDYSIAVFADRFNGYDGERFEILGEQAARRGRVLVLNQIVKSDGEAIAINYLASPETDDGPWRIIDTVLGGAYSELAARRTEYDGILEKLGIEALIQSLKDRTAGFARQ